MDTNDECFVLLCDNNNITVDLIKTFLIGNNINLNHKNIIGNTGLMRLCYKSVIYGEENTEIFDECILLLLCVEGIDVTTKNAMNECAMSIYFGKNEFDKNIILLMKLRSMNLNNTEIIDFLNSVKEIYDSDFNKIISLINSNTIINYNKEPIKEPIKETVETKIELIEDKYKKINIELDEEINTCNKSIQQETEKFKYEMKMRLIYNLVCYALASIVILHVIKS